MSVKDLPGLIKGMRPTLQEGRCHMASVQESDLMGLAGYLPYITDIFRENEGLSVVFSEEILQEMGSLSSSDVAGPFALITLNVHSDLMAVGFLARVTDALAKRGISVNAYSAYHHDHLLVPFDRAKEAMATLEELSRS